MKKINGTYGFTVSRRGYDAAEVDGRIKELEDEIKSLSAQMELVDGLKEENDRLRGELNDMKTKESEIKKVLAVATEKANDIKTDVRLQYALEIERLKIFQAKWTNAYEEIKERYHFDKDALSMEGVVTDTALQLEQLMYKDFGIKLSPTGDEAEQQFKAEAERLEISQDEINKLVEKLKGELKRVS